MNTNLLAENYTFDDVELISFPKLNSEESEIVRSWRNHPDIKAWVYGVHDISKGEHAAFVESLKANRRSGFWLVKRINKPIGVVSLTGVDTYNGKAYLGIYGNPFEPVKGAGSLLMEALIYLAFSVLKLHTLKLEVFSSNERAIGLYRKFGFEVEGCLREYVRRGGDRVDVLVMGRFAPEDTNERD